MIATTAGPSYVSCVIAQFSPLPPETNVTLGGMAAIFAGLIVAGILLLGARFKRKAT